MEWVRFLEENNVHYVTRGPNTKRGEVSIQCPMCGDDDPSEHLGINLETENWGCHRDASHRGKSARTLIKAILQCSSQQAYSIVRQYSHSDPDTLEAALVALEVEPKMDLIEQVTRQKCYPEFDHFNEIKARGVTARFFNYLKFRGFDNPYEIIARYNLRAAFTGKYKDRIIIPVYFQQELLGWTSRAIGKVTDAPRYLASSQDIKATVYNYDELIKGGERLFIVEGPFDAITTDNFSLNNFDAADQEQVNYRVTCTFGTSSTIAQMAILRALAKKYAETWILFDRGAEGPANELATWVGAGIATLPSSFDDPGELKPAHMRSMLSKYFGGHITSKSWLPRYYSRRGVWKHKP